MGGGVTSLHYMPSKHPHEHLYPGLTPKEIMSALSEMCAISCIQREVDENCALLGSYAARRGNSLRTFLDNLSVPSPLVIKAKGFLNL